MRMQRETQGETRRYHLRELEIAHDAASGDHVLPPIAPSDRMILDVGCGAGQTLSACGLASGQCGVGIDVDPEALALGRSLGHAHALLCARAECLPLPDDVFDLVISRVALPYTDIPRALAEITRVLRPGGRCWLTLHPMSIAARTSLRHLSRGELKGVVFQSYSIVNGLALHFLGRQFAFPIGDRRPYESCQTRRGIERALRAAGLTDVVVRRDRHFVITARKRDPVAAQAVVT